MNQSPPQPVRNRERVTAIIVDKNKLLGFQAIDPHSQKHYFFLPGGGIESNETLIEAAIRETLEETGFEIRITTPPLTVEYTFEWNSEKYFCKTHFFRGEIASKTNATINEPSYHKGVDWIPIAEIDHHLGYSQEILGAVKEILNLKIY